MNPLTLYKLHNLDEITVIEFTASSLTEPAHAEALKKSLFDLIDRQGHHRLVLDLARVRFMASSSISVIIEVRQKLEYHKGRLALCNLGLELRQTFKFVQLDRVFTFHPSRDAAVNSLKTSEPPG